eukprot:9271196-Heterocapsa_arctica.AAC.1
MLPPRLAEPPLQRSKRARVLVPGSNRIGNPQLSSGKPSRRPPRTKRSGMPKRVWTSRRESIRTR